MTEGGITLGFDDLRDEFTEFFSTKMPPLIAAARAQYDWESWELPDFAVYDAFDPFKASAYPILGVDATTDSQHQTTDMYADASLESWPVYSMVLFIAVATPFDATNNRYGHEGEDKYDATIRLRDRMTALVQNAMKNSPGLLRPNDIKFDPATINTTYPDAIQPNQSQRFYIAQSYMSFAISKKETTWNPKIGVAEHVDLEVGILNP